MSSLVQNNSPMMLLLARTSVSIISLSFSLGREQYALAFGDPSMIRNIGDKSTNFHVDATFGVLPGYIRVLKVRSSQVLNVVADYGSATVCVATIIMSCRKVMLYRKVFQFLKDSFPEIKPKIIMADWEVALRKTVAAAYPEARVVGCWYVK